MSQPVQLEMLVLGSGTAGPSLAWPIAPAGEHTAVVERQRPTGGQCNYEHAHHHLDEGWSAHRRPGLPRGARRDGHPLAVFRVSEVVCIRGAGLDPLYQQRPASGVDVSGVRHPGGQLVFGGAGMGVWHALLCVGFWNKKYGILGALGSCAAFIGTVTIIPFMPEGWAASAGGFPAMTGNVPFLMKDVVLLAVSVHLLKQDVVRVSRSAGGYDQPVDQQTARDGESSTHAQESGVSGRVQ